MAKGVQAGRYGSVVGRDAGMVGVAQAASMLEEKVQAPLPGTLRDHSARLSDAQCRLVDLLREVSGVRARFSGSAPVMQDNAPIAPAPENLVDRIGYQLDGIESLIGDISVEVSCISQAIG